MDLSLDECEQLSRMIQKAEAEFIERQSGTRALFKVRWGGQEIYVVYHRGVNSAVTALTPEMVRDGRP